MEKISPLFDLSDQNFLVAYRRETNAQGKIRLLALHHLQSGKSIKEVSDIVCTTRKTVHSWLTWYQNNGVNRLVERVKGRGRKPLAELSKEEIQSGIIALQEEREGGRITGDDIIDWLYETHGIRYAKGTIYNFLHRMGVSWISARSKHPKQDEAKQASFKKNLSVG